MDSVDAPASPATIDGGSDGPRDLPLGSGGAGGTGNDARRDTASGGQGGRGGATGNGGTTAQGSGGSGTDGATFADASVSACTGYQGVDGGLGPGVDGGLSQGLVAYYPCDQTSGASLLDSSGNAMDATLGETISGTGGTPGTSGYSFAAGKINNALVLNKASKGFAALPAGILVGACEATMATWVFLKSQTDWQRIWDFGAPSSDPNAPTTYMFLTTTYNASKTMRFAISIGGNTKEQTMDGPPALPVGEWHHVAVVLGPAGGVLYLDGDQVGSNPSMTLRPADLGSTPNNYLGRSQFPADPYLDGSIDDFRVYNRALSPSEIKALVASTGS
jgi:hypothetical protein